MAAKKSTPRQRWVTPVPGGGWNVKAPGAKRASAHTKTKAQATDAARAILRRAGGGELRVQNRDGRIGKAHTVPKGHESRRPDRA
jgi:hypothetical protein